MSTNKLKQHGVCRVFVSSPFGGFEAEREELVLKYFPQLSHLCQSKGVQFVAVDMRWGITEEASSDAQVVSICLREVDRSDIFVGLYGERYGWHGEKDAMLQKNIENAMRRYPWLKTVKDRSVTEMEFLHGHLNKPGALPAIIAFRDRNYDLAEKADAEKAKDTRKVAKFTVESDFAKKCLDEMKAKVSKTKDTCFAFEEKYKNPEAGAKFVFEKLRQYLEKTLATTSQTVNDKRELDLANHRAHLECREAIYVGGADQIKHLDAALIKGGQKILVVGRGGCGKAALVSRWLSTLMKKKTKQAIIYHFVGCASDSANAPDLMRRLTVEFKHLVEDVKKSKKDRLADDDLKPSSTDLTAIYKNMELALEKAAKKHKIILVIDGLGKVEKSTRTSKDCFWLPDILPPSVTFVGTCRDKDTQIIEELTAKGFTQIKIPELTGIQKDDLCKQLLNHHSKELSQNQLKMIVEAKQTGNPLFLKTIISELCAFGKYRELTDKIKELIGCKNVSELFQAFIRRLEADYKTDTKRGKVIEQVLCSIWVSIKGLSEGEIMAMHNIPSSEWSPMFFAMQHVMMEMNGLIRLGFQELRDAVETKYLKDKNTKIKYQKIVASYFEEQRKSFSEYLQLDDPSLTRPAAELPWLYHDMGDKKKLMGVLQDLSIFSRMFMDQEYDLILLWNSTGQSGSEIADGYLKAIEKKGNDLKENLKKGSTGVSAIYMTLIPYLGALSYFLEMAHYKTAQEKVLHVQLRMMEELNSESPVEPIQLLHLSVVKMKLAYIYTETGRFKEAEAMHNEVLKTKRDVLAKAKTKEEVIQAKRGLGNSYHGIAMLKSRQENIEEAIEYYNKALEIQKELDGESEVADSIHNLGVMFMKLGDYKAALELCTKSLKIYEELHFANVPPVIGVMIGNIAVCHRNLGQVDEAEKMYKKAIEISERSVGRKHPNVALGLMNLATLEINRQKLKEAETYMKECIQILEITAGNEAVSEGIDYYKCLEKYVFVLVKNKKDEEATKYFKILFDIAKKKQHFDTCWAVVYTEAVEWLMDKKDFKQAYEITMALLTSKQVSDKNYIHYDKICKALKKKPDPKFDLSKAVEKKPASLSLLRNLMETKLIPEGNLDPILKALDDMDNERHVGADLYGTAAIWCKEAKQMKLMEGILEYALTKFPTEANFMSGLAQQYYDTQQWAKVISRAGDLCKLEPNNPNHYMMRGDAALRIQDLTTARQVFNDILKRFPKMESIASQARQALDMINKFDEAKR